jgi:hypothetical protein
MSIVVGYDTEHDADEALASHIVKTLCDTYPGHGWFVMIRGGIVHIKNLHWNDKWGMCLHYSQVKGDAADRKKQVIRAAGEFLERAAVKRGAKDETQVRHIEGVPDNQLVRVGL